MILSFSILVPDKVLFSTKIVNFFFFISAEKTYVVVGTHKKHIGEVLLISTHNIIMFSLRNKKEHSQYTILSQSECFSIVR